MKIKSLIMFLLLSTVFFVDSEAEVYYPWKDIYIGALEGRAWAGLVLAPNRDSLFAFHIRVKKGNETAEGIDLFYLVSEVGPHSPDGRYARVKFDLDLPFGKKRDTPILKKPSEKSDTLTLEWSRLDERAVIGKISAPKGVEVQLVHYFPWDFNGEYRLLSDGQIKGESSALEKYQYLFWSTPLGTRIPESLDDELTISFSTEKKRQFFFVAGVGENSQQLANRIFRYKNEKTIDSFLKEEARRYQKKRVLVRGLHSGVAQAVTNNLFWMMLYQPGNHRYYSPAGRRLIFPKPDGTPDYWTIFEWDSFFNSLEVSVESTKHAKDILKSVLETQYPNGNIPNWRGKFGGASDRSQPPVGAYVVLKVFQKTGDIKVLETAYPYLKKWHSFWKDPGDSGRARRDGNGDGLLEWGSDESLVALSVPSWEEDVSGRQRAMWESGQDDLPNWDDTEYDENTGTLNINCLDLNSLYALDSWCLAQMANIMDKPQEYRFYLSEYEEMKTLIDTTLWNEREGFYFDRYWDGRFSRKKAASNFYPLLARIPDRSRALRMIRHLLNNEEYWGDYVIPTISRDDPVFKEQQYWRGTIWPPTNYLVYQGLKAYEFDVIASEFATKSAELFLRSWENFQLCPEYFDSRTGEAGGQRYQSWGPLFALIALEEYLDFTPWEGFRFGIIQPQRGGELRRISIQDRHYDIKVSPSTIRLKEEGEEIIKADGGAVFRQFLYSENEVSFRINSLEDREVKIRFLSKGKYQLFLDEKLTKIFRDNDLKIKIPAGEHSVLVLLLEKED